MAEAFQVLRYFDNERPWVERLFVFVFGKWHSHPLLCLTVSQMAPITLFSAISSISISYMSDKTRSRAPF
ncbi:unnamed protein product, partial [Mycena citricolor]